MAGTRRGVEAGRAYVTLSVNNAITNGLNKAKAQLVSFGAGMARAGAAVFGVGAAVGLPLLLAAKQFADAAGAIYDTTQRIGVSAEAFSELSYLAGESGSSAEALEKSFVKLQRTVADAGNGSTAAQEKLAALGLTAEQLASLPLEEQLQLVSDGLAALPSDADRTAAAFKVLGRSGVELLPILKQGGAALSEARKRARQLGITLTTEDAAAADRLGDAFAAVTKQSSVAFQRLGAAIAPILSDAIESLSRVLEGVLRFVDSNRAFVQSLFRGAVAVAAVGAALTALGTTIVLVGVTLGALGSIASAFGAVGALAAAAFGAVLSPIGLTIVAVGALVAGFVSLSGSLSQFVSTFLSSFRAIGSTASSTFGGVVDALMGGEIELAAQIAMQGVRAIFATALQALSAQWFSLIATVGSAWDNLQSYMAQALTQLGSDLEGLFESATTSLASFITKASAALGIDELVLGVSLDDSEVDAATRALAAAQKSSDSSRAARTAERIGALEREREAALATARGEADLGATVGQNEASARLRDLLELAKQARIARESIAAEQGKLKDTLAAVTEQQGGPLVELRNSIQSTFNGQRLDRLGVGGVGTLELIAKLVGESNRRLLGIERNTEEQDGDIAVV